MVYIHHLTLDQPIWDAVDTFLTQEMFRTGFLGEGLPRWLRISLGTGLLGSFTGVSVFFWILGKLRALGPHIIQLARLPGVWQSLGKVSLLLSMLGALSCCTTDSLLSVKEQHFLTYSKRQGWSCQNVTCLSWGSVPSFSPSQSLDSHSVSQSICSWGGTLKRRAWYTNPATCQILLIVCAKSLRALPLSLFSVSDLILWITAIASLLFQSSYLDPFWPICLHI